MRLWRARAWVSVHSGAPQANHQGRTAQGLNGPQTTLTILDNEVDPGIGSRPTRPLVPKPHAPDLMLVERIVGQKPLADSLELSRCFIPIRRRTRFASRRWLSASRLSGTLDPVEHEL
jgi:hypothetical protein